MVGSTDYQILMEPKTMKHFTEFMVDELYLAGERVPAGVYREIDTRREVRLDEDDFLPASLDGHAAAYICVQYLWGQRQGTKITVQ